MTIQNTHVSDKHPDGTRLGAPANPKERCMSGLSGLGHCSKRATDQRAIGDGPAIPLCDEHAKELDETTDAMWEKDVAPDDGSS